MFQILLEDEYAPPFLRMSDVLLAFPYNYDSKDFHSTEARDLSTIASFNSCDIGNFHEISRLAKCDCGYIIATLAVTNTSYPKVLDEFMVAPAYLISTKNGKIEKIIPDDKGGYCKCIPF